MITREPLLELRDLRSGSVLARGRLSSFLRSNSGPENAEVRDEIREVAQGPVGTKRVVGGGSLLVRVPHRRVLTGRDPAPGFGAAVKDLAVATQNALAARRKHAAAEEALRRAEIRLSESYSRPRGERTRAFNVRDAAARALQEAERTSAAAERAYSDAYHNQHYFGASYSTFYRPNGKPFSQRDLRSLHAVADVMGVPWQTLAARPTQAEAVLKALGASGNPKAVAASIAAAGGLRAFTYASGFGAR